MNYFLAVLKKYAVFSGRARRKEYWYFILFNIVFLILAMGLDSLLGTNIAPMPYGVFYIIFGIAVIIPSLAVCVRRLHDVGKSGWFYFISFIPIVGAIWLLVLFLTAGNVGDNEYGADPKAVPEQA